MLYHLGPNPTVDLIVTKKVHDEQHVLLIRRSWSSSAMPGKLAFPGGFVDTKEQRGAVWKPGHETFLEAARRELYEETGLDISHKNDEEIKFIGIFDDPGRDPRNTNDAWVEGHVFTLEIHPEEGEDVVGMDDAENAAWYAVSELQSFGRSEFAFDHWEILHANGFLS